MPFRPVRDSSFVSLTRWEDSPHKAPLGVASPKVHDEPVDARPTADIDPTTFTGTITAELQGTINKEPEPF